MNELELGRVVSGYLQALEGQGLEIEMTSDFDRVPSLAMDTGRTFQMPGFSAVRADHTENTAFWLFLKEGGNYVGGAAAMLQDLGRESLADYLLRTSRHQFPGKTGGGVEAVAETVVSEYRGRLAYIGELHFKAGHRGRRGDRLKPFMRMLHALTVLKWSIDWVYAFIPESHMQARLDLVYGFSRSIPKAQRWREPEPEVRSSSEWLVSASRTELEHMLLCDLLELDVLGKVDNQ